MKILLLGANGQLGRSFVQDGGLAARGELVVATREGTLWNGERAEATDLASPGLDALLDRVQPDLIINAAAYTAVATALRGQPVVPGGEGRCALPDRRDRRPPRVDH